MIEMNKQNKGYLSISYSITMACNNRCPYCTVLDKLDNTKTFDHEVFDQFKKAFNELDRTNTIELILTGGEPLFVDEIERIKELDLTNVELLIFSNLNYPEHIFKERLKLIDGLTYGIFCSFHESSNLDNVRNNILYLHENFSNVDVVFFITPENIQRMCDHVVFAREHDIPHMVDPIRANGGVGETFSFDEYGVDEDILHEMLSGSMEEIWLNNRLLTNNEIHEFDIQNISHIYYTQCEMSILMVSFTGEIGCRCSYKYKSHISKGIEPLKMVFCSNNCCFCTLATYKKLLRPKDRNASKKFHEYFGD